MRVVLDDICLRVAWTLFDNSKLLYHHLQDIASLWEEVGIDTDEQKSHEFPTFFYPLEELEDTTVSGLRLLSPFVFEK